MDIKIKKEKKDMEEMVIFIKTNNFKSKKNNKDYFTVEYLTSENLKYCIDFITKEQYENINDLELEALEEIGIKYKVGMNRNLTFESFVR